MDPSFNSDKNRLCRRPDILFENKLFQRLSAIIMGGAVLAFIGAGAAVSLYGGNYLAVQTAIAAALIVTGGTIWGVKRRRPQAALLITALTCVVLIGLTLVFDDPIGKGYFLWFLLARQSMTDDLTGLGSRRQFNYYFNWLNAHEQRRRHPFAIAIADHCKEINDTYGHNNGDQVLRHIAGIMKKTCALPTKSFAGAERNSLC
jgi:GGDEF domain-containing protein